MSETDAGSHPCPGVGDLGRFPLPRQCSTEPRHSTGLRAARKNRNSSQFINFTVFIHPHEPAAFQLPNRPRRKLCE